MRYRGAPGTGMVTEQEKSDHLGHSSHHPCGVPATVSPAEKKPPVSWHSCRRWGVGVRCQRQWPQWPHKDTSSFVQAGCAFLWCGTGRADCPVSAPCALLPSFWRPAGRKPNKDWARSSPRLSLPGQSASSETWNHHAFQQRRLMNWGRRNEQ